MEFLIVFCVSLVVLLFLALALFFGKPPTYRPNRTEILSLLDEVLLDNPVHDAWQLFLSLPINHDPDLDEIRLACVLIDEGVDGLSGATEGISGGLYGKEGLEQIKVVRDRLERLIDDEPVSKLF